MSLIHLGRIGVNETAAAGTPAGWGSGRRGILAVVPCHRPSRRAHYRRRQRPLRRVRCAPPHPAPCVGCPLREDTAGGCGASDSTLETGEIAWRFWREPVRAATFRSETLQNARFLVKWLAFAYLIQALLVTYVPAALITGLVGGPGPGPIVIGALVGAPAYLNGYAAPALVAGLMEQGMSAGAALSFMIAGA